MSDQLVEEDATYATHNKHNRRTSIPPVGFEPAIPKDNRPKTFVLDRTATSVGQTDLSLHKLFVKKRA